MTKPQFLSKWILFREQQNVADYWLDVWFSDTHQEKRFPSLVHFLVVMRSLHMWSLCRPPIQNPQIELVTSLFRLKREKKTNWIDLKSSTIYQKTERKLREKINMKTKQQPKRDFPLYKRISKERFSLMIIANERRKEKYMRRKSHQTYHFIHHQSRLSENKHTHSFLTCALDVGDLIRPQIKALPDIPLIYDIKWL